MITPAASADVLATPKSMQIENRKIAEERFEKQQLRSCVSSRDSPGVRLTQATIATAANAESSHASKKIGNTTTSSLENPT